MTNLPIRGTPQSLDNVAVTREEFRQGMGQLLEYLAQALGGVGGPFAGETVDPTKLLLQGEPMLVPAAVPDADDDSARVPSTAWVRALLGQAGGGDLTGTSLNGGQFAGVRNCLINGAFDVDTRGFNAAPLTPTYMLDRWVMQVAGAALPAQRIAGINSLFDYRISGAAGNTFMEISQRIESANASSLAGRSLTLSVDLQSTAPLALQWKARHSAAVDDFSSLTPVADGLFSVTDQRKRFEATFDCPALARRGLQISFTLPTGMTSSVLTIGRVQLERGIVATSFEHLDAALVAWQCARYYGELSPALRFWATGPGQPARSHMPFPAAMRVAPTVVIPTAGTRLNLSSVTTPRSTRLGVDYEIVSGSAGDCYAIGDRMLLIAEL